MIIIPLFLSPSPQSTSFSFHRHQHHSTPFILNIFARSQYSTVFSILFKWFFFSFAISSLSIQFYFSSSHKRFMNFFLIFFSSTVSLFLFSFSFLFFLSFALCPFFFFFFFFFFLSFFSPLSMFFYFHTSSSVRIFSFPQFLSILFSFPEHPKILLGPTGFFPFTILLSFFLILPHSA
ncbi:unnamed protein product [Acanthosepion pharaonis]|uniref:Uncharacterized protein n=1 Tax=Acanthosepion pharaonis TaxID=158019 RepID=A0A812EDU1_ACAPH|nr:unnamed protein product [Sepia pharaonis]